MFHFKCGACSNYIDAEPSPDGTFTCPSCNAQYKTSELDYELPSGYMLGGFRIEKLIGQGSSGNVYQATQISMHRSVAIKVLLHSQTQDKDAVHQFLNEVKTLGRIQHPNVVSALDAGEADGFYYLAMQFVNGPSFEEYLTQKGVIPEEEALKYAIEIAKALKYVWEKYKMLHRDIKPGNIMLNEDGHSMLLDMGIAQSRGDASIKDGEIKGSPVFMSPEQIEGKDLTWSTDLYSLGVSLYNWVTGVPPYDYSGEDPEHIQLLLEQHLSAPFPLPSERNPAATVSASTTALLQKMLAKTPEQRFDSWDAFIKEAEKILKVLKQPSAGPAAKRPAVLVQKKSTAPKKKGGNAVAAVMLFCLIVFLGTGIFVAYQMYIKSNHTAAKEAYEKAAEILRQNQDHIREALAALKDAKNKSEKLGVDPKLRETIAQNYEKIGGQVKLRDEQELKFRNVSNAAKTYYAEANAKLPGMRNKIQLDDEFEAEVRRIQDGAKDALQTMLSLTHLSPKMKDEADLLALHLKSVIDLSNGILEEIAKRREAQQKKNPYALEIAEFKEQVEKEKQKIRRNLIDFIKKDREEYAINELLSLPRAMEYNNEEHLARYVKQFKNWLAVMRIYRDNWAKVHAKLEEKLAPKEESGEESDVDSGRPKPKKEIPYVNLAQLKKIVGNQPEMLYSYLLFSGRFAEAKQFADELEIEEMNAFMRDYLSWHLEPAIKDANNWNDADLQKLDKEYGDLPEYKELRAVMMRNAQNKN